MVSDYFSSLPARKKLTVRRKNHHLSDNVMNYGLDAEGLDFMVEDFKDTSEHLRITLQKMELPFQIYAAGIVILITAISSFGQTISTDPALFFNSLGKILVVTLLAINTVFLEWSLRATETKNLYINRLNFLRWNIYKHTHIIDDKSNKISFLWITKMTTEGTRKFKIGMNDIIPWSLIIFTLLLGGFCWFWAIPTFLNEQQILLGFNKTWIYTSVGIIILIGLFFMYFMRWTNILKNTKIAVDKQWQEINPH